MKVCRDSAVASEIHSPMACHQHGDESQQTQGPIVRRVDSNKTLLQAIFTPDEAQRPLLSESAHYQQYIT